VLHDVIGDPFCSQRVKAKFHYAIWIEPASNKLRTSSEPAPNRFGASSEAASVMEFGFYSALSIRKKTPFPPVGDAAYRKRAGGPSHGHRQHAQKIGKDRACGSGDILSNRQTDRQTHSSQYFATALARAK